MPSRPVLGAEIDDWHVHAGGGCVENLGGFGEADRHRVDQDVAVIAGVETHLPAHRGHAERIAVAADAGDHAGDQILVLDVPARRRTAR